MGFLPAHIDVFAPGRQDQTEVAFFLHGILGAANNLRSFTRKLVTAHPRWLFCLVDLRNHGDSVGAPGPHTVAACAEDIARLAEDKGVEPSLVLGHSFGGKVALEFAAHHARDLDAVWLLDSPPGPVGDGADEVTALIETLRRLPMPIASRPALVTALGEAGVSDAIANWMTTNLKLSAPGKYDWRFDLDAIAEMLADYRELDRWPVIESLPDAVSAAHLVIGGKSERWSADDRARLARAVSERVSIHTLEDAGHWVHVDDPDGLHALVDAGLSAIEDSHAIN